MQLQEHNHSSQDKILRSYGYHCHKKGDGYGKYPSLKSVGRLRYHLTQHQQQIRTAAMFSPLFNHHYTLYTMGIEKIQKIIHAFTIIFSFSVKE